jgi:hypothetical protein
MDLTIDHVPFAWSDHDELVAEFSSLGLAPEYGGEHDNGVTQMSAVCFDDGSYVELVAPVPGDVDLDGGYWPAFVRTDGGPCAWCVEVDDVVRAVKRAVDAGVPVAGPWHESRERADGVRVEWDRAEFGGPDDGQTYPFAIADRTPRAYRVQPTESVSGGPLTGIADVVVAVPDLDASVGQLDRLYRLPTPRRTDAPAFGARLASFPGQPLTLATPLDGDRGAWLAERLDAYGTCPCACLLGVEDLDVARDRHPLQDPETWFDRRVAWVDSATLARTLGVVEL